MKFFGSLAFIAAIMIGGTALHISGQTKPKPKPRSTAKTSTVKPAALTTSTDAAAKTTPPAQVKCLPNGLTETETKELVDGHNRERKGLGLTELAWDCALANLAQDWANRSLAEHRDTPLGENIFVSANSAEPVATVLTRWMSEKPNWDNTAGQCTAGKVCTHYTQLVNRSTTKFGCGINRNATGKWKTMLVCNYDKSSRPSGPAY